MSYKKEIAYWLEGKLDDVAFLEAVQMWVFNPSSLSANYGGETFWKDVEWNLALRYGKDRAEKVAKNADEEIDSFFTERRDAYNVFHAIEKAYNNLEVESAIWQRILSEIARHQGLSHDLIALTDYLDDTELWFKENGVEWKYGKQINAAMKKRGSSYSFEDLLKIGVVYKVTWVKVSASDADMIIFPYFWDEENLEGLDKPGPISEETTFRAITLPSSPERNRRRVIGVLRSIAARISTKDLTKYSRLPLDETRDLVFELVEEKSVEVRYDPDRDEWISKSAVIGPAHTQKCAHCGTTFDRILISGESYRCPNCGRISKGI